MVDARPNEKTAQQGRLRGYDIDTLSEQAYDDLALLAAHICGTPMAVVSFVNGNKRWFKAQVGVRLAPLLNNQFFYVHATFEADTLLIVPDAQRDVRFKDNPLVTGDLHIRFYASAPLIGAEGQELGNLCVFDRVPRALSRAQEEALRTLARQVMRQLELRRVVRELDESEQRFRAFMDNSPVITFIKDDAGRMVYANRRFEQCFRLSRAQWLGKDDFELWPDEVAKALREHDLNVLSGTATAELIESVPTPGR